jgi:hypothetical protein
MQIDIIGKSGIINGKMANDNFYPLDMDDETIKTIERNKNKMNKIDFRKNGAQVVNMVFDGKQTVTFAGICPVTGVRLYESTGSNDPRGQLGIHAVTEFVAEEYSMIGPTLKASWIACNNDRGRYEQALEIAKRNWVEEAIP